MDENVCPHCNLPTTLSKSWIQTCACTATIPNITLNLNKTTFQKQCLHTGACKMLHVPPMSVPIHYPYAHLKPSFISISFKKHYPGFSVAGAGAARSCESKTPNAASGLLKMKHKEVYGQRKLSGN